MSQKLTTSQKQNLTTQTGHFVESKPFPPLGTDAELLVYDDYNNSRLIPLEDWQLAVIQQVLGIYCDEDGNLVQFTKESVQRRIKNIPELHIITNQF